MSTTDDSQVSRSVRDYVVALLWIPPILLLLGGSVAVAVALIRIALEGSLTTLSLPVDPTLVVIGVASAIGILYLTVMRETFGGDTVEAAQQDFEDTTDQSDTDDSDESDTDDSE
jgi:hypothetical protein